MGVVGTGNPQGLWPKGDPFFNSRTQLGGDRSDSPESLVEMG